ncbi:hypothetical protein F4860DRAFT_520833 [Xylaria cubensis]|nr:hypothetical protein F4860DRAFT_520833 [Xylaria cubensis]
MLPANNKVFLDHENRSWEQLGVSLVCGSHGYLNSPYDYIVVVVMVPVVCRSGGTT